MSKYTAWHPSTIKPERPGVYECSYFGTSASKRRPVRRLWTGDRWIFPDEKIRNCTFALDQRNCWRGLTRAAYLEAGGK